MLTSFVTSVEEKNRMLYEYRELAGELWHILGSYVTRVPCMMLGSAMSKAFRIMKEKERGIRGLIFSFEFLPFPSLCGLFSVPKVFPQEKESSSLLRHQETQKSFHSMVHLGAPPKPLKSDLLWYSWQRVLSELGFLGLVRYSTECKKRNNNNETYWVFNLLFMYLYFVYKHDSYVVSINVN